MLTDPISSELSGRLSIIALNMLGPSVIVTFKPPNYIVVPSTAAQMPEQMGGFPLDFLKQVVSG